MPSNGASGKSAPAAEITPAAVAWIDEPSTMTLPSIAVVAIGRM